MTIVQSGSTNLTALIVPNVFVNIIPPGIAFLNGVASNIMGLVGLASWGPVNAPTLFSDYPSYKQAFGDLMARTYDMGTHAATAILQGAANFRGVRITDGTDVAAFGTLTVGATPTAALLFTGYYTGIRGNLVKVTFGPGTAVGSWRVVVALPGLTSEVFDNITGTGAALWQNIVAAINNGAKQQRGPSTTVIASLVATPSVAPVAGQTITVSLTGGLDGGTTITSATIVGVDGTPRTGCYALRGTGCAVIDPCDLTDLTQFNTVMALALSEGFYAILAGAAGECSGGGGTGTVAADSLTVAADTYAGKVLAGDWCLWNDPVTLQQRFVSPAGFLAGALANLSPEQSALNLPLFGIAATQTTYAGKQYSDAELNVIAGARFDVLANPSVGGSYFSSRIGINFSSNAVIHGDNYSRLTPYIARTFNAALGKWVGKLQTPTQRLNAKAQADSFFQAMWDAGQIGNADGTVPFNVELDSLNNPAPQVALGYETSTVDVEYLSVIEKFIMNLTGGQSVVIASAGAQQSAAS